MKLFRIKNVLNNHLAIDIPSPLVTQAWLEFLNSNTFASDPVVTNWVVEEIF